MPLRRPSLTLGSVAVFARRLCIFDVATVNRKFKAKPKSSGFEAFPATPSNPALNSTGLMTVELTPCPPSHSGCPTQNNNQKHMFLQKRNVH